MKRSLNQKNKYMLLLLAFIFVVNVSLGVALTRESSVAMKEQIQARMLDVSNVAASMIDGDVLATIQKDDFYSPEYQDIKDTMRHFQDNVELRYIYCVRKVGENEFIFTIDAETEDPADFGEPVVYTDALYRASLGEAAVDSEPYADRWGRFYSSYSPVFSSQNEVAGIVAVDFDARWYEGNIRRQQLTVFINACLSVGLGFLIVLAILSQSKKRVQSIYVKLNNLSHGIETIADELSEGNSLAKLELIKNEEKAKAYSHGEIDAIEKKILYLQEFVSAQIVNVKSKAYIDGLTGLANRTAYLEYAGQLDDQIKSGSAHFWIAMFDLNGLKALNDTQGHDKGDLMLMESAALFKKAFGKEKLFRIGGDEFVVIIEGKTVPEVERLFEEFGELVSAKNSGNELISSISKGYAEFDPDCDKCFKDTFTRADKAMYADKKAYYEKFGDRRGR